MIMTTVVYVGALEGYEIASEVLCGISDVVHVKAEKAQIAEALKTADAYLDASMKVRLTDDMIKNAQKLKIISTATTGSDHIERAELDARAIPVWTLKEDRELLNNITPAAELSWALLMACARNLPAATKHVEDGQWVREEFPGIMLNGRKLGLVGCGRIGGWMSRYAKAFGMDVIGYDPILEAFPQEIKKSELHEIFETCDFISIHVHLSETTTGLVTRTLLESVKSGAVFINTSRGALVDETALLDGLKSGRIGAAGLDVLEGEPQTKDHPLVLYARDHDNLLITPHCGGFSPDAVRVVCAHAAKKIKKMFM